MKKLIWLTLVPLCSCLTPRPAPPKYPTTQAEIDAAFEQLSADALRHAEMSRRRPRFLLLARREAELALSFTGTWEACYSRGPCISDSAAHQATVASVKKVLALDSQTLPLPSVRWSLTGDASCKPLLDELSAELDELRCEPTIPPIEANLQLQGCVFSVTPGARQETSCQVVVGYREGGCGEVRCGQPVSAEKPCTRWSSTAQVSVDGVLRFATQTATIHHAWSEVIEHQLIDGIATTSVAGVPRPEPPSVPSLLRRTAGSGSPLGAAERPMARATVFMAILGETQPEERSVDCAQFPLQPAGHELDLGLGERATAACPRLLP
jgi:hypothetical protein